MYMHFFSYQSVSGYKGCKMVGFSTNAHYHPFILCKKKVTKHVAYTVYVQMGLVKI